MYSVMKGAGFEDNVVDSWHTKKKTKQPNGLRLRIAPTKIGTVPLTMHRPALVSGKSAGDDATAQKRCTGIPANMRLTVTAVKMAFSESARNVSRAKPILQATFFRGQYSIGCLGVKILPAHMIYMLNRPSLHVDSS